MSATDASDDVAFELKNLSAGYGGVLVVGGTSLRVRPGEILGLAGESGCGKSTMALAAMGFRHGGLQIRSGQSLVGGQDLLALSERSVRGQWGATVAYVPQGAAASLNPAHTISTQFRLLFRRHLGLRSRASDLLAGQWLDRVGLPADGLSRYPHQFSGGQQQRISLALAIACRPSVLILDEPTTGLDVTTQAQITAMLREIVDELSLAAVYVSHDLALLGGLADRLAVMYAGEIIEAGPTQEILLHGRHPYSRALLRAAPSVEERRAPVGIPGSPPGVVITTSCAYAPRCERAAPDCRTTHPEERTIGQLVLRCHHPIDGPTVVADAQSASGQPVVSEPRPVALAVRGLTCRHRGPTGDRTVVEKVSLEIRSGETLALVGESGSGKSTLLRAVAGIHRDAEGQLLLADRQLPVAARSRDRVARGAIQLILQNSDTALNPRRTVGDAISRSLELFRPDVAPAQRRSQTATLLDLVQLPATSIDRLPGTLSGGQRQRVAFARAFASRPKVLLCDEVTSALDVSVQATILSLLDGLAQEFDTAVLFVSHDLAVVRSIANRVVVMQSGRFCETSPVEDLFSRPTHPYTSQLLASAPSMTARSVTSPLAPSSTAGLRAAPSVHELLGSRTAAH